MARKLAGWAVLALLLYYAVTDPAGAAGTVRDLIDGAKAFADGLTSASDSGGGR